jgi:hypothetical protein
MNRNSLLTLAALSMFVACLSGCAGPAPMPGGQAQSPAYNAGFDDGCASGRASQGSMFDSFRKNVGRYDTDAPYAQGWSAGFSKCADQQQQTNAAGNGR